MTPSEHNMADEPSPYLGGQIRALRQRITTVNMPGNLDGLVAWYLLRESSEIRWCVDPISGSWLKDNAHRLEDAGAIAVLGYGLSLHPSGSAEITATVCAGLRRLMQRSPFPGDRLTSLHDIRILFGVCLAAESAKAELPEFRPWLQETLADPRLQPADRFHELAQRHTHATLARQPVPLGNPSTLTNAGELAMACWMVDRGTANLSNPLHDERMLKQLTMRAVLRTDPSELAVPQAALLLWAADHILGSSADQMVLSLAENVVSAFKSYDFFISYAGPDIAYAQTLSDTLQPVGRIFLAPQSLMPGEDWPTRLPIVIRDTWVTLVIISQHTPAAHFQMEEILLAIREVRTGFHTVIPIRLSVDGEMPPLPIGLNSKNCLDLRAGSQIEINSIIDKLLAARDDIRSRAGLG